MCPHDRGTLWSRSWKGCSMKLRRIAGPVSAIVLAIGLVSATAPADASVTTSAQHSTNDTGWGLIQ